MNRMQVAVGIVSLLAFHGIARAAEAPADAKTFSTASLHLEQNATDGDFEIVVEALAEQGLATLTVTAPDGRVIVDYKSAAGTDLGMRQFRFETPEPEDLEALKKVYPEGVYTFAGTTGGGAALSGKGSLSHTVPPASSVVTPTGARPVMSSSVASLPVSSTLMTRYRSTSVSSSRTTRSPWRAEAGQCTRFSGSPGW